MAMNCGGLSETKGATPEIQRMCDEIKHDAEKKAGIKFPIFYPILYRDQVVAGMNYFTKVNVGDGYVHIRMWKKLPCVGGKLEFSDIQLNKTLDDPIIYF